MWEQLQLFELQINGGFEQLRERQADKAFCWPGQRHKLKDYIYSIIIFILFNDANNPKDHSTIISLSFPTDGFFYSYASSSYSSLSLPSSSSSSISSLCSFELLT
jgi:hypothetical protein